MRITKYVTGVYDLFSLHFTAQCNFFLHKSYVELPCKKQHPLHWHMLTLQSMRATLVFCDACKSFTNGFTYECKGCKIKIDVSCSLILDTFIHVGHKHPFILSSVTMEENCSACNHKMKIFCCTKCEFLTWMCYASTHRKVQKTGASFYLVLYCWR